MKSSPKIGTTGELQFVVEPKHVIEFATDGMPAVLSTPNLIGLLERTARKAIDPFLEAEERSVGIEIELRHLAPALLGAEVTCITRVYHVEGRKVDF
jgi:predicted thioesterase